jgi:3-dehydroquinate dehydratase-1
VDFGDRAVLPICLPAAISIIEVAKMTSDLPKISSVVGTIHSDAALRQALRLKPKTVDFLEVRVDHFIDDLPALTAALRKLKSPLIITVRHPDEGGAAPGLSFSRRAELYRQFLPFAALIDVELRSAKALSPILDEARKAGVGRILSWHDFQKTPSTKALRQRWEKAREFAPEIIKFATRTRTARDFARLLDFLVTAPRRPAMSLMGMREFGKISRLTLARSGSVLNYGYLGELQVPGQWEARELKEHLALII